MGIAHFVQFYILVHMAVVVFVQGKCKNRELSGGTIEKDRIQAILVHFLRLL